MGKAPKRTIRARKLETGGRLLAATGSSKAPRIEGNLETDETTKITANGQVA